MLMTRNRHDSCGYHILVTAQPGIGWYSVLLKAVFVLVTVHDVGQKRCLDCAKPPVQMLQCWMIQGCLLRSLPQLQVWMCPQP